MKQNVYRRSLSSVAAALAISLSGCTVLYEAPDPVAEIQSGATKVQVSAALGAPDRIIAAGDRESWLYCRKGAVLDRFILAVFKGANIESVTQAMEFDFGACDEFFKGVTQTKAGN